MDERAEVRIALDDVMPKWHRREQHRLAVDAPGPVVIRAARELTWREVPAFRQVMIGVALGRVEFPANGMVLDMFLKNGFEVLHHSGQELVIGGIERISRKQPVVTMGGSPADTFREFDQPKHFLLGFNFRFADGILTTETRVRATDAKTRRIFAVYWFAIRAGSGLIRRIWLRGIRRRALRTAVN